MKKKTVIKVLICLAVLIFYLALACLPIYVQPSIAQRQADNIQAEDFYGREKGAERAKIISENGEALSERVRLIANARERIILSTFDFQSDNSGKILMAALLDAADRGVQVNVMMDGFSYFAHGWGNPYFLFLAGHENVEFRVYNPVNFLKPWKLMARMHDKYLIADDDVYILGGRNCYDYFLGEHDGCKNYDWDVLVSLPETLRQGASEQRSSLSELTEYFFSVWDGGECVTVGKNRFWSVNPSVAGAGRRLEEIYEKIKMEQSGWLEAVDYDEITVPTNRVRLVSNPVHTGVKEPTVYYIITELLSQPGKEAVFHTPYIICSDWMLRRLEEICRENPDITMMTNSVANNGNPFGAADYLEHREEILGTGLQPLMSLFRFLM